jgi:hypothetical protein
MAPRFAGVGSVFGEANERLKPAVVVLLAVGLLTAMVTDGSVPALVTKGLLTAMALWMTDRDEGRVRTDG